LSRLRCAGAKLGSIIAVVALLCGATTAAAEGPAPKVKKLANSSPTHLLFVGNSYLYYGDSLHNHVRRMVIAAGIHKRKKLKYKSATISGSALFDHNIASYLEPGKLRVRAPFQVVILQGGSAAPLSERRRDKFRETVEAFSQEITKAGGQPALYMTHAYVAPHRKARPDLIRDIAELYVEAGNAANALVIPVGLAFEEAYRQRPDMKLHKSFDGSHPDLIGTYLAAAVVFTSLYGQSPAGNSYDYFGKIDKDTAGFLQKVAAKTVRDFYARN
jgi:hypothetical protein